MPEFEMQDYLASARGLFDYLGAGAGQQVMLIPTLEFLQKDLLAVETLQHVGKELGARMSMVVMDALGTRGDPPDHIARAIEAVDIVIGMGDASPNPITGHCLTSLKARWDFGLRQVDLMGGRGVLATECAKIPYQILLAIARCVNAKLRSGNALEISDDKGTQLHLPYHPSEVFFGGSFDADHLGPGQRCDWPLGQIIMHTGDEFSGVAMMDCIRKIPKRLVPPVKYVFRNCATEIEDREETRRINAELAKPVNTNLAGKLFLGINPKGSITEGMQRSNFGNLRQAAGVACVYIGDKAGYVSSEFTTGAFLFKPTIRLNGELICERGRLSALDDSGVRAIASKYGDADQLLTQLE